MGKKKLDIEKYRKEEKYVYSMHVHPAFYEPINQDSELEELRDNTLDIHKNERRHWNIFLIK